MMYDAKGSVSGEVTDTHFVGRLMQNGSYFSQVEDGTDPASMRLIVTFNWDTTALESAVDYIEQAVMEGFKIPRDFIDIIDGRILYGDSNLADISFSIFSDIGGVNTLNALSKLPLGGLDETNLEAVDITVPASPIIVAGTISENPDGTYVYTYGAPILASKDISIRPVDWADATPNYIELTYDLKDLVLQVADPSS